jgi:hypothetical protein
MRKRQNSLEKLGAPMRTVGCLVFSIVMTHSAFAEDADFIHALSFALTGSDGSQVQTIDRKKCIFRIGADTYYLNNVQPDRLLYAEKATRFGHVVTIELHGSTTVYANFVKAVKVDPNDSPNVLELHRLNQQTRPEDYRDHVDKYSDWTLEISTNETARMLRVWKYIFSNGCSGHAVPILGYPRGRPARSEAATPFIPFEHATLV